VDTGSLLDCAVRAYPHKEALVHGDRRVTYAELSHNVDSIAANLLQMGIKKGSRVALLFYNSVELIESILAVFRTGGIAVPLNFRLTGRELEYIINNSGSEILIMGHQFAGVMGSIREQLDTIREVFCVGGEGITGSRPYQELLTGDGVGRASVAVEPDDGCSILYTSGTTGFPKGALRSQHNVLWNSMVSGMFYGLTPLSTYLGLPPMFHLAGFECTVLPTLWAGGRVVIMDAFEPQEVLELIEREKVTHAMFVPSMFIVLMEQEMESYDLSSLKCWNSGTAPVPPDLVRRILDRYPEVDFRIGYGSTEAGVISALRHEDQKRKTACVGNPIFGQKVRVVDGEMRDLPQGEIGEIVCQSPMCIREYFNNPEATADTVKDGWLRTGDLGRYDEEGYLYIAGRVKDMIISGGENVYAVEVENILFDNPKVLEAAVIGLPHHKWGEMVSAVVVLKEGHEMTEDEAISHCRKYLAGYKCPKVVKFVQELPKNTYGKVLKAKLVEQFS
jgi:acyl-CoA synthetase (AMP-forming)/AMP-acid ligase II